MDKDIDEKYEYIVKYANVILDLKAKYKETKNIQEENNLQSSINYYRKIIDDNTNNSSDYIILCVNKINTIQNVLNQEEDFTKKEIYGNAIDFYKNHIKSRIKNLSKEASSSKQADFRNSKKVDLLSQAKEISQMCDEHRLEMRLKDSTDRDR